MQNTTFETITYDQLLFAKLSSKTSFDIKDLYEVDGVIIEYTDHQSVLKLIDTIRSHQDKAIYLLPVFLSRFHRESNKNIARFADGVIKDLSDLSEIGDITHQIKERI